MKAAQSGDDAETDSGQTGTHAAPHCDERAVSHPVDGPGAYPRRHILADRAHCLCDFRGRQPSSRERVAGRRSPCRSRRLRWSTSRVRTSLEPATASSIQWSSDTSTTCRASIRSADFGRREIHAGNAPSCVGSKRGALGLIARHCLGAMRRRQRAVSTHHSPPRHGCSMPRQDRPDPARTAKAHRIRKRTVRCGSTGRHRLHKVKHLLDQRLSVNGHGGTLARWRPPEVTDRRTRSDGSRAGFSRRAGTGRSG